MKQERVQSWGWCPQAAAGSGGAQGMEQPEVAASLRIKVLVKFNGQSQSETQKRLIPGILEVPCEAT